MTIDRHGSRSHVASMAGLISVGVGTSTGCRSLYVFSLLLFFFLPYFLRRHCDAERVIYVCMQVQDYYVPPSPAQAHHFIRFKYLFFFPC